MLVFGDIGVDDITALLYGYLNDDIEIVGVVTDYGNIPRENALRTVQYLKSIVVTEEAQETPIITGAENPMTAELPDFVPEIHGEYGLGPITPPTTEDPLPELENFYEIIGIIDEYEGELNIVNIGRLTSLATLYLLYPLTMEKVKAIYIMGGAFWVPGNVTAVSEANFHGDPVAAQIVLTYADNVTIIPLNVTERAIATQQMVDYIDQVGPIDILKPMIDYYYEYYRERNPNVQGAPLHDVLTLMAVNRGICLLFKSFLSTSYRLLRGLNVVKVSPISVHSEI